MPVTVAGMCRVRRPSLSLLFPYTTLFRSRSRRPSLFTSANVTPCFQIPAASPLSPTPAWSVTSANFQLPRLRNSRQLSVLLRSEEHTSELQSQSNLVCRLLLEKKKERSQA